MINLSPVAQEQAKSLLKDKGEGYFVRLSVKGGGCSGFSYDFRFDNQQDAKMDKVFQINDIKLVCDLKSLLYLDGMTVDYSTELVGGGFKFINPNAKGSCGCGTSFSA